MDWWIDHRDGSGYQGDRRDKRDKSVPAPTDMGQVWSGDKWTAPEPSAADLIAAAANEELAGSEFLNITPEKLEQKIRTEVVNIASAQTAMIKMGKVLLAMARKLGWSG